jgi:hypothetical protein
MKIDYWKWIGRTKTFGLEIYMKSGNVISLDGVTEYSFENKGNEIISFSVKRYNAKYQILAKTVDLTQIEAIVKVMK